MLVQDEVSTLQLLKGHQSVEQTVEAYAESVGLLSQQCQHLLEIAHPERCDRTFRHMFSQCSLPFSVFWPNGNANVLSICKSEQIMKQQSHIDRLYLSVKDMVEHRKTKLEQQYWLYQLNKDVEELEKWITEREVVASSTELGQDLEDVTVSVPVTCPLAPTGSHLHLHGQAGPELTFHSLWPETSSGHSHDWFLHTEFKEI